MLNARNNAHPPEEFRALLLTDSSFRVAAVDNQAALILTPAEGNGNGNREYSLPQEIASVLRKVSLSDEMGQTMSVQLGRHVYLCRVSVLHPCNTGCNEPLLALYMSRETTVEQAIANFAAEYDLTERERQALLGVAAGLTSKEIAEEMNISPNTVKSFLRLVMGKIGVTRRGGLISKVLDHHRHGPLYSTDVEEGANGLRMPKDGR